MSLSVPRSRAGFNANGKRIAGELEGNKRDEEGFLVASVPSLPGCHTQARTMDELRDRIKEAIQLCREVEGGTEEDLELVGIQRITV